MTTDELHRQYMLRRKTNHYAQVIGRLKHKDDVMSNVTISQDHIPGDGKMVAQFAYHDTHQPVLTVWEGDIPESNGKLNFTAVLMRKGAELFEGISGGMTIARSEYPDRVRYEADRVRWLIGELKDEPCIIDYDAEKHSGYKARDAGEVRVPAAVWARQCDLDDPDDVLFVSRERVEKSGYTVRLSSDPIPLELLRRALKADASIGASAMELADGWAAMAELRALLAQRERGGE